MMQMQCNTWIGWEIESGCSAAYVVVLVVLLDGDTEVTSYGEVAALAGHWLVGLGSGCQLAGAAVLHCCLAPHTVRRCCLRRLAGWGTLCGQGLSASKKRVSDSQ